jgi:hypothetical protein
LDVTPTLLALLGEPVGRDMDGDVALSLLSREFESRHTIRYVPAHTEDGWFDHRPKIAAADDGASERIEQLRALGYLVE